MVPKYLLVLSIFHQYARQRRPGPYSYLVTTKGTRESEISQVGFNKVKADPCVARVWVWGWGPASHSDPASVAGRARVARSKLVVASVPCFTRRELVLELFRGRPVRCGR